MIIDCGSCTAGPHACSDCVVTFMTIGVGAPRVPPARRGAGPEACAVDLDEAERAAIDVLARSGLVPPLRMERAM